MMQPVLLLSIALMFAVLAGLLKGTVGEYIAAILGMAFLCSGFFWWGRHL